MFTRPCPKDQAIAAGRLLPLIHAPDKPFGGLEGFKGSSGVRYRAESGDGFETLPDFGIDLVARGGPPANRRRFLRYSPYPVLIDQQRQSGFNRLLIFESAPIFLPNVIGGK